MTSFLEQIIEYVVGMVIPGLRQSLLRYSQPCGALDIRLDGYQDLRFVRQWQTLSQNQLTVFVKCLDCRSHL